MSKRLVYLVLFGLVTVAILFGTTGPTEAMRGGDGGGRGNGPIIFVENQGLYFDSIITADPLPPHGPFQDLYVGPNGLTTEFGPGDPGYRGGRWVEDIDGDGELHYFLCPLLPPGRESP